MRTGEPVDDVKPFAESALACFDRLNWANSRLGCCVGWPAAPVTVSNGGCAQLPVSRQNTPGVASGDTHQRRCLVQGHALSKQTVQNLESCLVFLSQCHILHQGSVTFMLAS